MDVGRSLIWCVVFIFFIIILVFLIEKIVPISKKLELDRICSYYLLKVENNGGLNTSEIDDLNKTLTTNGFTNIKITVNEPETVKFGNKVKLSVTCSYRQSELRSDLKRSLIEYPMEYQSIVLSRRIIN